VSTLVQALCGGVVQTTPYIGHPAYKAMGCRAAYTLATGLFIGLGAATGLIGLLITLLPESLIVPILIFVGIEMSAQAVLTSEPRHVRALGLALVPVLAYLSLIQINGLLGEAHVDIQSLSAGFQRGFEALTMLANGFIVTAMLWASWLVWVIDGRFARAAGVAGVAALLTLFGAIHSPYADGRLFWPVGDSHRAVYALAGAYVLLALLALAAAVLGTRPSEIPPRRAGVSGA
jgi:AGZA family xanthine/uracil permease-like MFS transporter